SPVTASTRRTPSIEPSAAYEYSTRTRPRTWPSSSTSQNVPETWMDRLSPHAIVPAGGAPADQTPLARLSHPSLVVVPAQSRMTVTAIGEPSARHSPTVATGSVGNAQAVLSGPQLHEVKLPPTAIRGSVLPRTARTSSRPTRARLRRLRGWGWW